MKKTNRGSVSSDADIIALQRFDQSVTASGTFLTMSDLANKYMIAAG